MFLRNFWYVAATIPKSAASRCPPDPGRADRVLSAPRTAAGGLRGSLRASSSPALDGQAGGRPVAVPLPWPAIRPDRPMRAHSRPGPDPASAKVKTYPVVERYRWVWIWMGDPALADPAKITDFHWLDDPAWGAKALLPAREGELAARRRTCSTSPIWPSCMRRRSATPRSPSMRS